MPNSSDNIFRNLVDLNSWTPQRSTNELTARSQESADHLDAFHEDRMSVEGDYAEVQQSSYFP